MNATDKIHAAARTLGIEIRIMTALTAHAKEAGADEEVEDWQSYRISEAFEELKTLIDHTLPSKQ